MRSHGSPSDPAAPSKIPGRYDRLIVRVPAGRQTVRVATATRTPAPWTAPTAAGPVRTTVRLPGSKSMTARALVLAAVSPGTSTLHEPLRARDTELMAGALRALGPH